MSNRFTSGQLTALAEALPPGTRARAVLRSAGFPLAHLPVASGLSRLEFWQAIDEALESGVLESGHRRVLAAARVVYPAHPVFRATTVASLLVVAAAPADEGLIQPDREFRVIETAVERLSVTVDHCPAAELLDLRRILSARPDILHLICHGRSGELIFQDASGNARPVPVETLVSLLRTYRAEAGAALSGIVLGSCYGSEIVHALGEVADVVIAHEGDLDDECAIAFAGELYRTLPDVDDLGTAAAVAARHVAVSGDACASMADTLVVWPVGG
ncbi:effector-associated domain EAD1-containing protein [Amycolatopsis sp. NPDC048633]|uniref:effector-associated domain EAD1-containing protein n=1 Tax=Amycolatopsis sp. NPDC048633 TaxID=3157095 RepID=UPI0033CEC8EF